MKKPALLSTVNCRQMQTGFEILRNSAFVVSGARDITAPRRAVAPSNI